MPSLRVLAVALILAAGVAADGQLPDWSKRTFSAPADRVFAAALQSIAAHHHKVTSTDEVNKVVGFHVGMTAWVWGYDMVLRVAPGEKNTSSVSIEIAPHNRDAFGGSGQKEVRKILDGISKALAKTPPAVTN
jgi:hypothetical protein